MLGGFTSINDLYCIFIYIYIIFAYMYLFLFNKSVFIINLRDFWAYLKFLKEHGVSIFFKKFNRLRLIFSSLFNFFIKFLIFFSVGPDFFFS